MESSGRSPFAGNFKRLRTKLPKALAGKTRSMEKSLMQDFLLERDPEKRRAHSSFHKWEAFNHQAITRRFW